MAKPTRISELQTIPTNLQGSDQFVVARGSGPSGQTYKVLASSLLKVASTPTINLNFDTSSLTLSANATTALTQASAFNVANSPTINLDWNPSTRTLSANSTVSGPWKNISSAYTVLNNDRLAVNTSGGSFTITLPQSPVFGNNVTFIDQAKTWDTNNLTIARNGSTIEGLAENLVCDVIGDVVLTLLYNGSTWRVYG